VATASAQARAPADEPRSDEALLQCLARHEAGQEQRADDQIERSLATFTSCANVACPGPVRDDCQRWADELELQVARLRLSVLGRSDSRQTAPLGQVEAPRSPDPSVPSETYWLGGLGLVGLAGFAALGLSSRSLEAHLQSTCAPECPNAAVDRVRERATWANVSLGTGATALVAAGAVLWFHSTRATAGGVDVTVEARNGGAAVGMRGTFF
jgi:hypothetical protein